MVDDSQEQETKYYTEEEIKMAFAQGYDAGLTVAVLQHLSHIHQDNPIILRELQNIRRVYGDLTCPQPGS
ncbi:MAG: hypothetical protein O0X93_01765 [Methanocorpusculum sp.]|nr:hypothetical protein [Methanocorpusculum sp.]MDE2521872.1 hypothetical protein [Methanocorpusculum sp.]MDE2524865.1 hypothetical protein [Methanocorpusculum sp.]